MDRQEVLIERKQREKKLAGKYVVIVTSRYQSNVDLYLQDSRYGSGYWTRFRSNAKGYTDECTAIIKARNLQHGSPRVALVNKDGSLKEVYKDGKRTGGNRYGRQS